MWSHRQSISYSLAVLDTSSPCWRHFKYICQFSQILTEENFKSFYLRTEVWLPITRSVSPRPPPPNLLLSNIPAILEHKAVLLSSIYISCKNVLQWLVYWDYVQMNRKAKTLNFSIYKERLLEYTKTDLWVFELLNRPVALFFPLCHIRIVFTSCRH